MGIFAKENKMNEIDKYKELQKKNDGLIQINLLLHAAILNMLYFINLGQLENAKSVAHTVLAQLENIERQR